MAFYAFQTYQCPCWVSKVPQYHFFFSLNEEDHVKHVSEVLRRLWEHNLFANGKKCVFHMDSIEYLGHIIGPGGLWMDPGKVKIIQDWLEPKKVKGIQSFLGFASFYRWYIHNYSNIVVPLTVRATAELDLTKI